LTGSRRKSAALGREQYDLPRSSAPNGHQELLAEHGHQFATIKTEVKTFSASVQVNFNIKEGRS